MTLYLVFSFYSNKNQAKKIAKIVVKNKLAACANINANINSIFIWKKKLSDEKEIEVSFKTNQKNLEKLILFLKKTHPYECPCIYSFKTDKVNNKFLKWVKNQTL